MDESRRGPSWWRVLAVPFLILLMVPLALLMALAYHVRAVFFGVGQMLGWSGGPEVAGSSPLHGPHFPLATRRLPDDIIGTKP